MAGPSNNTVKVRRYNWKIDGGRDDYDNGDDDDAHNSCGSTSFIVQGPITHMLDLLSPPLVSLRVNPEKKEIIWHYKTKKFNLWTSLEHVFTLIVSAFPFSSSSKKWDREPWDGWAEWCKVSKRELSLTAALPEEQKQKSHLYL